MGIIVSDQIPVKAKCTLCDYKRLMDIIHDLKLANAKKALTDICDDSARKWVKCCIQLKYSPIISIVIVAMAFFFASARLIALKQFKLQKITFILVVSFSLGFLLFIALRVVLMYMRDKWAKQYVEHSRILDYCNSVTLDTLPEQEADSAASLQKKKNVLDSNDRRNAIVCAAIQAAAAIVAAIITTLLSH